jgi:hypothetical protein
VTGELKNTETGPSTAAELLLLLMMHLKEHKL